VSLSAEQRKELEAIIAEWGRYKAANSSDGAEGIEIGYRCASGELRAWLAKHTESESEPFPCPSCGALVAVLHGRHECWPMLKEPRL